METGWSFFKPKWILLTTMKAQWWGFFVFTLVESESLSAALLFWWLLSSFGSLAPHCFSLIPGGRKEGRNVTVNYMMVELKWGIKPSTNRRQKGITNWFWMVWDPLIWEIAFPCFQWLHFKPHCEAAPRIGSRTVSHCTEAWSKVHWRQWKVSHCFGVQVFTNWLSFAAYRVWD